jgi:hypothetical protein
MSFVSAFLDELSKLATFADPGKKPTAEKTNPVLQNMDLRARLKANKPAEPKPDFGPPPGPNQFLAAMRPRR